MKVQAWIFALPLLSLLPLEARAARLQEINFNGSGCPTPDAPSYGFDGQWLTLDFDQVNRSVRVNKGSGTSLEESRRNCAATLNLETAQGYRFALERVVAWGQYKLGSGDQFTFDLRNFFQGAAPTAALDIDAQGPSGRQNYTFDRKISKEDLLWSACNSDRALTLNASLRVGPQAAGGDRDTSSQARLDKIAYRFVFQKCN